ncbi:hypothetical protein Back11_00900 [Paenibacillus baekrokdamisoli]|uniref:Uncharacterized protein n=1 Tax=Paenibacillus baekrokdamisoli TaxID=1712516 RepID=A0A3G9IS23_9BACL|nr:hypothetical protein [Paenibacillus baekrokdamisoli]MBB3069282.1 hypothetical protein [Paenibacillus baekrokdamisoli]BBH18745.1 hypothetical protein Back11_00900 [Paenibacillus baekrokdamisoli]
MKDFLIFVAPFIVVIVAVGFLFWWGGRGKLSVDEQQSKQT